MAEFNVYTHSPTKRPPFGLLQKSTTHPQQYNYTGIAYVAY